MKKLIALSIILLLFSLNADDFLTIPLFFENRIPADIAKIEEMASNLVKEKIGIGLRIIPITRFNIGDVDTRTILELEMMKKEGIIFDITNDLMPETEMIPLTTMLNEQGKEILRIVKENGAFFDIEENGIIRKLPSVSDIGMATGIAMRADILEKYSIDADKIKTIDDIDAVFKVVSENEPDMRMISGYQSKQFSPFSRFLSQKAVKGQFFVLDENDRLVN